MFDEKLEVSNLITPVINAFRAINNEWKNLFDIGLTEYLHSQTTKYYYTNTFMHRGAKVEFNSIYYPLNASHNKFTTDFKDISTVFSDYKNLTLIGSAGSGKTTLVKYIFLEALLKHNQIPLIIELRFLNDYNGDFEKLITDKVLRTDAKPSLGILKRALKGGKFIFLLDGYDEVYSQKKQEINRQIECFMDSYSANNFIVTTRPGSGIEGFPRFYDFRVNELTNDDINGFLDKLVESEERRMRIQQILSDPKNISYNQYLRNPLLLSMFIVAFESHPEIPSKKSSFYRNVFDTLYSKHDGITKNSFPREKITGLEKDDFEKVLNVFSYLTFSEGKFAFTEERMTNVLQLVKKSFGFSFSTSDMIYDLQTTISILILDGFEFKFPHRSMQEYFAAQFLSSLPDDKKAKAYQKIIEAYKKFSNDSSFHFWSLCQELDEYDFIAYFLIPELTKLEKMLDTNINYKDCLKNYFKVFRYVLFTGILSPKDNEVTLGKISSFSSSLTRICGVSNQFSITKKMKDSGAMDELIKEVSGRNKNKKGTIFSISEDNYETLIDHGIIEIIQSQRETILKQINYYKDIVKTNKLSLDDILGI